jgi:hypothetical protein
MPLQSVAAPDAVGTIETLPTPGRDGSHMAEI